MSFRWKPSSSQIRRDRILAVESSAPVVKSTDVETIKNEVIADIQLTFDGGTASQSVQPIENIVVGDDGYIESSVVTDNNIAINGGGA